jgi:pimeloyl-ACP methyl ester carboxylesterase
MPGVETAAPVRPSARARWLRALVAFVFAAAAADAAISALAEDSGFAAIGPIAAREWRKESGLPDFLRPTTTLAGRLLLGWSLDEVRPVDALPRVAPRPVLIGHGDADALVPIEHARELRRALPSAEYWEVPGAPHAGCYERDPGAYVERVAGFFERSL